MPTALAPLPIVSVFKKYFILGRDSAARGLISMVIAGITPILEF